MIARGNSALAAGEDLTAAAALGNHALELALRDGSPGPLGRVHLLLMMLCHWRGDLAGAEKHFAAALEASNHPSFRRIRNVAITTFGVASWNAWAIGQIDVARGRIARMMAAANRSDAYEVAFSDQLAALLWRSMREYEEAEAVAARAVELSEKHQFVEMAAICRCVLGHAQAQLGRATEGIALIRQGIAGLQEIGKHFLTSYNLLGMVHLADRFRANFLRQLLVDSATRTSTLCPVGKSLLLLLSPMLPRNFEFRFSPGFAQALLILFVPIGAIAFRTSFAFYETLQLYSLAACGRAVLAALAAHKQFGARLTFAPSYSPALGGQHVHGGQDEGLMETVDIIRDAVTRPQTAENISVFT